MPSIFTHFFKGFDESKGVFQNRMEQLDKDFERDLNKIAGSFIPFLSLIDADFVKNNNH